MVLRHGVLIFASIIMYIPSHSKVSALKYCKLTGNDDVPGCKNYENHLGCESDVNFYFTNFTILFINI